VFKRAGLAGVNFAFIGDPLRYHTPVDDLGHLDRGSLQHHGDNALAMVRALGSDGGEWSAAADAVFFDVLSFGVVRWPEVWTAPLAAVALLLVAIAVWRQRRRGAEPARYGWGFVGVSGVVFGTAGLAWGLGWLLAALGATPYAWSAHPLPLLVAFWSLPLGVTGAMAWLLGPRWTARGVWSAAWLLSALAGTALAVGLPGVAYPFVVPSLVSGLFGVVAAWRAGGRSLGLAGSAVLAVLVFPFAWKLYEALGTPSLPGIALVVAQVLIGCAGPALALAGRRARAGLAAIGLLLVLGGAVAAVRLAPFTADAPRPLPLVLYDGGGDGGNRWLLPAGEGELPPQLREAAAFAGAPEAPLPWSAARYRVAPADAAGTVAPPELQGLAVERRGGSLLVRGRLLSSRNAAWAGVFVPASRLAGATIDGVAVTWPPRVAAVREDPEAWLGVEHVSLPDAGAALELTIAGEEPLVIHLWDGSPGVGPAGASLLAARPPWAVPIGRGDRTVVSRPIAIPPPG
jgi:hypothetical protein